jgi:hypothetical protein
VGGGAVESIAVLVLLLLLLAALLVFCRAALCRSQQLLLTPTEGCGWWGCRKHCGSGLTGAACCLACVLQGRALPQSAAAADPNGGVWVVGLSKGSEADRAGMEQGDQLLRVSLNTEIPCYVTCCRAVAGCGCSGCRKGLRPTGQAWSRETSCCG